MNTNHSTDVLTLKSAVGSGLKLDISAPDYGWDDLRGEYIIDNAGANAPTTEVFVAGRDDLGFNATDICRTRLHLIHCEVAGGVKYAHPHIFIANGATAATTNLVLSHQVYHSYGSIGSGDARGANPTGITLTQTITVAEINAIGSGKQKAFDIAYANSGGTGGLLNSDNMLPDDIINIKTTVTSIPIITGGTTAKIGLLPIDGHRQVTGIAGTKNKDRSGGSFYGTT